MQDFINSITSSYTPVQIAGAALVVVFLFKKLVKWAIIVGALFILIPYLNESGALDSIKNQLGL